MSLDKNETLYDKTVRQLKNNPIVVIILVIGAVAVGLSQSLDVFNNIRDTISPPQADITEVGVAFQKFNSAGEYDGAPILRSPVLSDLKDIKSVASDIVDVIVNEVRPLQSTSIQTNLEINDGILTSDVAIDANLIALQENSPTQQGTRIETTNLLAGENISQRFTDPIFFSPDCNCINFELNADSNGYEGVSLKIYRFHDGYSFNTVSMVHRKTVDFHPTQVRVLIESLQGTGANEDELSATNVKLDGSIRQQLQEIGFVALSPYKSQTEYQAEIEGAISTLPLSEGKWDYLQQHGVDYIVTITYIVK